MPNATASTPSDRSGLPSPIDYLVSATRSHQIVMLGDQRGVSQHLDMVAEAITPLHHAGVSNLVWEFTNSRRQGDLDELCQSPTWNRRLAVALFVDLMGAAFGYEQYIGVLHAVWQHNQNRPDGWPPFRVVAAGLPSYVEDPDLLDGRSAGETELRDWWLGGHYRDVTAAHMANIITTEVLRTGERAVVYADAARTNTRLVEHIDGRPIVAPGVLLSNWMGEGIARIVFHGAIDDNSALERVEELVAASPDPESRFGLSLAKSTLGNVRVHDVRGMADGRLGPFDLAELADGYLFIVPRGDWTPVSLAEDLLGPDTLRAAERRYRALDPRDTPFSQEELESVRHEGLVAVQEQWPDAPHANVDAEPKKRRLRRR